MVHPRSCSVAQQRTINGLNKIHERVTSPLELKQTGLLTNENEKQLNVLLKQKKTKTNKLKRLQNHACAWKLLRDKQRKKLRSITESHPDVGRILMNVFRGDSGRSSIDDTCPALLSAIEEIASLGDGNNDRRRKEVVRTYLTLDGLRER